MLTNEKKILAEKILGYFPDNYILINIPEQKLYYIVKDNTDSVYDISTAEKGVGNKKNSFKTPYGLHIVKEKYGDNLPPGAVFKARNFTGEIWDGSKINEDLILSRILRLAGLEDGINKGGDVDTYERFIYIHGTNHEDKIGRPVSHGCIRMKNKDIIDLYDKTEAGTLVCIE